MRHLASLLLLLSLLSVAIPAQAEDALTNAAVVSLVELDLGDEVVIAKINQAPSVAFTLATEDLAALKEAGVSGPVIAAMLDRSTAPVVAPAPAAPVPTVRLVDSAGEHALVGRTGAYRYENRLMVVVTYADMDGLEAELRVSEPRPTFLIKSENSPSGSFFLAHARRYDKKGKREVKGGTMSAFGGGNTMRPHEAWTVEWEAEQTSPGLWTLRPTSDLGGGEFAIWRIGDSLIGNVTLYDFAIDGPPSLAPWDQEGAKQESKKRR